MSPSIRPAHGQSATASSRQISPVHRNRQPLILTFLAGLLTIGYVLVNRGFSQEEYPYRTFAFLILLALVCLISCEVFSRSGKVILDPGDPLGFYSIFFTAFYLLPFALIVLDPRIDGVLYVRVGLALALGFLAFKLGCTTVKGKYIRPLELDNPSAWALLITAWIAMGLVGYLYYWRLRNGNFYTHANSYTVGTDTTSSLLESFVNALTLPSFFLSGSVASSNTSAARFGRLTIKAYLLGTFLIFLAASQLRFSVTVLILAWTALHLFQRLEIEWRKVLQLAAVGLTAAVFIFTIRASGAGTGLSDSDNQLRDLVRGVTSGELLDTTQLRSATTSTEGTSTVGRAVTPLIFFSDVIQALDSPSTRFGLGDSLVYELKEVIPRLLWKEKPEFLSTQIFIRGNLGMREVDSSPHPFLQFYYEFGWPGIAAGFFVMGAMIQYVATRMRSMFMFFLFAFIWSSLIQGEAGLFLNLLVGIRAALLLYGLWAFLRYFISIGMKPGIRRSAFNRHGNGITTA